MTHPQAGAPVAGEALLEPCARCGSSKTIVEIEPEAGGFSAGCASCGEDAVERETQEAAINAWNLAQRQRLAQPHRSEPDQGDSRARLDAILRRFAGASVFADPVSGRINAANEIIALFGQASEQRTAGAVGEPVGEVVGYYGKPAFGGEVPVIRWAGDFPPVGTKLYAAPTASGDARDAERLDWLAANPRRVQASIGYGGAKDAWMWKDTDHNFHVADTLRASIDAARGNHD